MHELCHAALHKIYDTFIVLHVFVATNTYSLTITFYFLQRVSTNSETVYLFRSGCTLERNRTGFESPPHGAYWKSWKILSSYEM